MAQDVYGFSNITANGTFTPKTGGGTLKRIVINNPGSAWVLTIFDSTTGAGTKIGTVAVNATEPLDYDCAVVNGITIVTSGTTPGDATVIYG